MSMAYGLAVDHARHQRAEVWATVEQLMQACVDRGLGFQETAADVSDEELARVFRSWSGECFRQAEQLGECVDADHVLAEAPGTWLDGWRRIWFSARAAVNVGDRAMMLCELERAEVRVYEVIENLLAEVRDPLLIEALGQQLSGTREIIDGLRELRTTPILSASRQLNRWVKSAEGGSRPKGGSAVALP